MSQENGGKGGFIVNIASIEGLKPTISNPIYCATKSAIITFTRAIGVS